MTSTGGIVVLLFLLFRRDSRAVRILSGTISSAPVQDTKIRKIRREGHECRPQNRQVPFVSNPTLTHTTGLNMASVLSLRAHEYS